MVREALSGVGPGDVLFVKGSGQLTRIGANGGLMGHVMVVLASPQRVQRLSRPGRALAEIWPEGADEVWRVPCAESTSQRSGLNCSHMIVQLGSSGELLLVGEETENDVWEASERLEIWRCPVALRTSFRAEIVVSVMKDMLECQADWSYTTAVRAVFQSATIANRACTDTLREEVESSWEAAPICTSVVISFWQRYLQQFASMVGLSDTELWLRWMPLKADRGLPGELLTVMKKAGWLKVETPLIF